jgi:uncharacterized membrane protein HdeD (DUF308 family)
MSAARSQAYPRAVNSMNFRSGDPGRTRRRPEFLNQPATLPPMAHLILALFLFVFGLNLLFGLSIPIWVTGLLAIVAGILLAMEHFRVRLDRK